MAKNFLYMFEFVVDDLLITSDNMCAPEGFPTCVEFTFRKNVYVTICDKNYYGCKASARRSGKSSLFALDRKIMKDDKLLIEVYRKRTEQCKFLLGVVEVPVYWIFNKVTNDFYKKNPDWDGHLRCYYTMLRFKKFRKVIDYDCCGVKKVFPRTDCRCPSYEISKKVYTLRTRDGSLQTGDLIIVMRLSCMGPTIVTPFLLKTPCCCPPCCPKQENTCCTCNDPCCPCKCCPDPNYPDTCCPKLKSPNWDKDECHDITLAKRYFGENAEEDCPSVKCRVDLALSCQPCDWKRPLYTRVPDVPPEPPSPPYLKACFPPCPCPYPCRCVCDCPCPCPCPSNPCPCPCPCTKGVFVYCVLPEKPIKRPFICKIKPERAYTDPCIRRRLARIDWH